MRADQPPSEALFVTGKHFLDVRSPIEVAKGTFPRTCNIPLLNDQQRHEIGICYKNQGQQAATELGYQLVKGDGKIQRIAAWKSFANQHPQGYLFCFRGGLRSQISQQWLKEAGIDYPRISGGYKAMRQVLLGATERLTTQCAMLVIGGKTGVGKTVLINNTEQGLDLEGLAGHRGSSFGRKVTAPRAQVDFEHQMAIRLLNIEQQSNRITKPLLVVEDECRRIGSTTLPQHFFERMKQAPMLLLELPLQQRIENICQEYVVEMLMDFAENNSPEQAFQCLSQHLLDSLQRISRRLGGANYQEIRGDMQQALKMHQVKQQISGHQLWIEKLLLRYYDPMYSYQLQSKQEKIQLCGDQQALLSWIQSYLS